MDYDSASRVIRVKMWLQGHSFEEIDNMSLADFGDVIGYWQEKNRVDEKEAKRRQRVGGH